jgi:uncharacterized protein (DUF2237 family)
MGALNVLGGPLQSCSLDPLTGWLRDGCCHTDGQDQGSHVVCTRMTPAFLNWQLERGNDLITPRLSCASPASSRATAGASARCAGARPTRPVTRRR